MVFFPLLFCPLLYPLTPWLENVQQGFDYKYTIKVGDVPLGVYTFRFAFNTAQLEASAPSSFRLGLVSDSHAGVNHFMRHLGAIRESEVNLVVHTGDVVQEHLLLCYRFSYLNQTLWIGCRGAFRVAIHMV